MRILGIDTALGACSACVLDEGVATPVSIEQMPMAKGHAEALMPLIERVMGVVGGGFKSLSRVAVTVGPGSYTGLRVGLAAARAIGLAANIPVIGVTTLAATIAHLIGKEPGRILAAALNARYGQVYFQVLNEDGRTLVAPRLVLLRDAARLIGAGPVTLAGSGALLVAQEAWAIGLDAFVADTKPAPDISWIARLGISADPATSPPRPLYLKAPDAQPQGGARLSRLGA